ncbi:MAG: hypothetical protein CMB80_08785 [Flammeovirgaceae bacterium]|nr:hypothetical protein [Flammeovirgaceae bacterium]|tara:strand:+ start:4719 stop:5207 length:489 start_codon:yes stop_codon:yes gene_type:complete
MAHLKTPKGEKILVDREDLPMLRQYKWRTNANADRSSKPYVYASNKGVLIFMHKLLMRPPKGMIVDHINGDVLDNRKSNLRVCTQKQNLKNRLPNRNCVVRAKGVHICNGKFRASIKSDNKRYDLGSYTEEIHAAIAYNVAAKILHGEFARVNDLSLFDTAA